MSHVLRIARASRFGILSAFALLALVFVGSPALAESWEQIPPNPRIGIEYIEPTSPGLINVYKALKARKVLEEMQRFYSPLDLPHHLTFVARECGVVNAWYDPVARSITICYEITAYDMKIAPETVSDDGLITREGVIVGDFIGTFLHESGHMMFHMYNAPVYGREEDAADEMAIFLALRANKEIERTVVKGIIYFWSKGKDPAGEFSDQKQYSDEHGTASQRMYNSLCLAYGGDPKEFQVFIDKGWLPKKRAEHCAAEYARLKVAFEKTIEPFLDQDLLARVAKTDWLTPEELK